MSDIYQAEKEVRQAVLEFLKTVLTVLFSALVYAFGLVAPLTPSVGYPSFFELFVFLIVPVLALVVRASVGPASSITRVVCVSAAIAVVVSYIRIIF